MKFTFVSQASILIQTADCTILTDPWYKGTAFNDSWKLFPEPAKELDFEKIDYLWVSHEHPDHFNIPTLKAFPVAFKEKVTILFQKNNSSKMADAFARLGFKNIRLFENRKIYQLTDQTKISITQIGQMDSALAVIDSTCTLLNVNDCEVSSHDCKTFHKELGKIDVVFNQFSMAGFSGSYNYTETLPDSARRILQKMTDNHRDLQTKVTIPFASNIYFCTIDNKFINDYANTPQSVADKFDKEGLACRILFPEESYDSNDSEYSNSSSLEKYRQLYNEGKRVIDVPPVIDIEKIRAAVDIRSKQLKAKFPKIALKKLKTLRFRVPDLNAVLAINLFYGTLNIENPASDFDLEIYSQPLFHAFDTLWGIQTIGVGGRYKVKNNGKVWKWYRIISSLNNAEMYLKFKYIFTLNNYNFIRSRMKGGINQLLFHIKKMG